MTTTNSPALGELISNGWLTPLNQSMMSNFRKYASRLAENPPWDPGNTYTMAWQSGWTAIGYNSSVVKNPGTSVGLLFDKKYAGKVGMMNDPQELGSVGLLAIGVDQITFETDYPHQDSTWPHTHDVVSSFASELSPTELRVGVGAHRRFARRLELDRAPRAAASGAPTSQWVPHRKSKRGGARYHGSGIRLSAKCNASGERTSRRTNR